MVHAQPCSGRRPANNSRIWWLLASLLLLNALNGGCRRKGDWLVGKWLLVEEGKPSVCHQFNGDGTFAVYVGSRCSGATDPLLSGKWQIKKQGKLALQRGNEEVAHLALLGERSDEKVVSSGAISGILYRVGEKGAAVLLAELERRGLVKVRALPPALGCEQLGLSVAAIRKLPREDKPRMVRARDEGLEYHATKPSDDPLTEKVVYALNQDQVDWIAFHLTAAAFGAPGPEARLERHLGKPETATTGTGNSRQHISMWRSYCAVVGGTANQDVDVTLFAVAARKEAYYYVSPGVVSGVWDELRRVANDPSEQAPDEEAEDVQASTDKEPSAAASTEAAPAPAKSAPVSPPPPAPKTTTPTTKDRTHPVAPPPAAKAKPTPGRLAVPGSEDEI